jgi:hypothetical protein
MRNRPLLWILLVPTGKWILNYYELAQIPFERSNRTLVTSDVFGYIYRLLGEGHLDAAEMGPPIYVHTASSCIIDFDKGQMAEISDLQTR